MIFLIISPTNLPLLFIKRGMFEPSSDCSATFDKNRCDDKKDTCDDSNFPGVYSISGENEEILDLVKRRDSLDIRNFKSVLLSMWGVNEESEDMIVFGSHFQH